MLLIPRFLGQVVFQYKDLPIYQTLNAPENYRLDKRQKRSNVHGTLTMTVGVVPQLNGTHVCIVVPMQGIV